VVGVSRRDIPSLDGLRAISVALVVLSHLYPNGLSPLGLLGVRVFFVISGYLITRLLITELDRDSTIRLGRFYLRRALRIFPAYYVMLAVAYLLGAPAHWSWLLTYTSNVGPAQPFDVAHAWSLAVEEQFYTVWPVVLLLAGRRRGLWIALVVIAAVPVVRLVWFLMHHNGALTFATPDDFLAVGCALALTQFRARRWVLWLAPLITAYHEFFALSVRWRFAFDAAIGQTLCALAIAAVIAWAVTSDTKILNNRVVRALGIGSYSMYLYQQFWMHMTWPLAVAGALASATASYVLVERPGLKLRRWLESLDAQRPDATAPFVTD
jgi:peptidoglycan/LPS O-acetylase OafA/YrhL